MDIITLKDFVDLAETASANFKKGVEKLKSLSIEDSEFKPTLDTTMGCLNTFNHCMQVINRAEELRNEQLKNTSKEGEN